MEQTNLCGCTPVEGSYTDLYLVNKHDGLGKPLSRCSKAEVSTYAKDLACAYLEKCGLVVVDLGWQATFGSADIVCRDGRWGVLVEVRASVIHDDDRESPVIINAGTRAREKYKNATIAYYSKHSNLDGVRYDVIGMRIHDGHEAKLRHIVSAFGYSK